MRLFQLITLSLLAIISNARADCLSPVGVAGQVVFNSSYSVPQYCDSNDQWIAMSGGNTAASTAYTPNAVVFDGGTGLTRGALTGVADGRQATFSFWTKFNANVDWQRILSMRASSNDHINIQRDDNDQLLIVIRSDTYNPQLGFTSTTTATDGEWHHFMASFDATTNSSHFYMDGVSLGTAWTNPNPSIEDADYDFTDISWGIGRDPENGWNPFDGEIADLWVDFGTYIDLSIEANRRMYIDAGNPVSLGIDGSQPTGSAPDIFMSGDTATWHQNKGTGGDFTMSSGTLTTSVEPISISEATQIVPLGLVGHWRLDESSGSVAYDSSGNGFHINYSGSLNPALHGIKGKVGQAVDVYYNNTFRGSLSSGSAPLSLKQTDQITMSAWVKMEEDLANVEGIIRLPGLLNWNVKFNDARFLLDTGAWGANATAWGPYFDLNEWVHIAVSYDYNLAPSVAPVWYVNGEQQPSYGWVTTTPTGPFAATANTQIFIANSNFPGAVDDIRIYDRILDEDEVVSLYQARDGIRYNQNRRTYEYFDGNRFVSMTPEWSNVDAGPILGCTTVGSSCADGTIYVGDSPDGDVPMFTTLNDEATIVVWSTENVYHGTNLDDFDSGQSNQEWAETNLTLGDYPAFEACANANYGGHDDWYLPSVNEGQVINVNKASISNTVNQRYWSSTENSATRAFFNNHISGFSGNQDKTDSTIQNVRCVRKGSFDNLGTGGLVGHWKLDETSGTTAVDSAGNNDGTMNGSMDAEDDTAPGAVGTSLTFDGVDDFIEIPAHATLDPFPLTVSGWIKVDQLPTETGNDNVIIYADSAGSGYAYKLQIDNSDDEINFSVSNAAGTNFYVNANQAIEVNRWHHAVGVFDSNYDIKLFINGALQAENNSSGSRKSADRDVMIGKSGSDIIGGQLDDVRIYDYVLTPAAVHSLYQMGSPVGSSTVLPQGCPNIGDVCDDGTIYAGLTDSGATPMFTTPFDAPGRRWSTNGAVTPVLVGGLGVGDGMDDTLILVKTDSDNGTAGFQTHQAAQYCYDLVAHGADDWYLPLRTSELRNLLCNNQEAVGNFGGGSNNYWSTTQSDASSAGIISFGSCNFGTIGKGGTRSLRCVRKGPAPRCANPYGLEGQMIYNSSFDVVQYCDGARWIAIGKYEP